MLAAFPAPPSAAHLFSHLNSYMQFVWPVPLQCQFVSQPEVGGCGTSQVFTSSPCWGCKPRRAFVSLPAGKLYKRLCKPNHARPRITLGVPRGIYLIPPCRQVRSTSGFSMYCVPHPSVSWAMLSWCSLLFGIMVCFSGNACYRSSAWEMLLQVLQCIFSMKPSAVYLRFKEKIIMLIVGDWLIDYPLVCYTPVCVYKM